MRAIEILKTTRAKLVETVSSLSNEQLLKIPQGFNNNILWNLTHLLVTQQILNYKLSGLDMHLDEKLIEENRKGSSPSSWTTTPDIDFVKQNLVDLPIKLEIDYNNKIFTSYKSYMTSLNFEIKSIEDSIEFNNFHEGIHLGSILALKKLVCTIL